jgi:hypothetical protein
MQGMRCQTEKAARLVSIANANNLLPPRAITNFQKMLRPSYRAISRAISANAD